MAPVTLPPTPTIPESKGDGPGHMEDHKPPHPLFAGLGYQSLARSALKIDRPRAQKLWDAEN